MNRMTLSALLVMAAVAGAAGTEADAGSRHHGYGHGYYANHAPGSATIAYYGHGYWYRTPYYHKGVLSDYYGHDRGGHWGQQYYGTPYGSYGTSTYYGGYRPSYSHGLYTPQYGVPCRTVVPYDYAPYSTQAPTTIAPSVTGADPN